MKRRATLPKRFIAIDNHGHALDTVTGEVVRDPPEEGEQTCPRCKGRGFVWSASGPTDCPTVVPLDPVPKGRGGGPRA